MTEIVKCDKCKTIRGKRDKWVSAYIFPGFDSKRFDLCPKCAKPFLKYIKKFFRK